MAAAKEIYPLIDAANIDVKGFSEEFYKTMCGASLQPVLALVELIKKMGVHVELTNLVIPGKNDSDEMLDAYLDWVETKLGFDVPLHFQRITRISNTKSARHSARTASPNPGPCAGARFCSCASGQYRLNCGFSVCVFYMAARRLRKFSAASSSVPG